MVGAVIGLRRGIPLWSYTWLAFAAFGITRLVFFVFNLFTLSVMDGRPPVHIFASLYALGLLVSLAIVYILSSRRGFRHGLTFYALGFGVSATSFYLWPLLGSGEAIRYISLSVASVALVVLALGVYHFLKDVSTSFRLFWLVTITAMVTLYLSSSLPVFVSGSHEHKIEGIWMGLTSWGYIATTLLLACFVSWLGERRRRQLAGA